MLDTLWAFFKDPTNRATLGWIGAGVAAVVGAIWAVVKFLSKKEPGPAVQARDGSIAAGGDITGNQINTGADSSRKP
jgi:hypothetical protein